MKLDLAARLKMLPGKDIGESRSVRTAVVALRNDRFGDVAGTASHGAASLADAAGQQCDRPAGRPSAAPRSGEPAPPRTANSTRAPAGGRAPNHLVCTG